MKLAAIVPGIAALAMAAGTQSPCGKAPSQAAVVFFVEPASRASDTVATARLCLASTKPVGSYAATLSYDSTRMRLVSVVAGGGMQATNTRTAGVIRIAGASPEGYTNGALATITFRPIGARALDRIALTVTEASTVGAKSLLAETKAAGWPVSPEAVKAPSIDSISPPEAEVSHERVTDLVIYGSGFAATGNVVVFGKAEVAGLVAERGGTMIRFAAPSQVPAPDGNGTRRIEPGPIQVRVRHAGGSSNPVTFIVKDEGR